MIDLAALTLGFVPIARTTFDIPLAESITAQARAALTEKGYDLTGPQALVSTLEDAQQAARQLADEALDLVVIFQATFADSTMVMALAEAIDAPLMLWSVPEERTGGRLRLNSLCGINLAGHALTRTQRAYDYLYTAPDSPDALR